MKKFIFSFVTLLLTVAPAMAQYYSNGRPIPPRHRQAYGHYGYGNLYQDAYYGFRLGLGISTVGSNSPVYDAGDPKTGLNVGVVVGTQLTRMAPVYFETGLYYTEKGGKTTYNNANYTYGLDYLELPMVFKYRFLAAPDLTIDPFLGGYLALGVAGKIKDYGNLTAHGSFDNDYPDSFKRFDGGLKMGVGASFQMLYFEASYDLGLANVGSDSFNDAHNSTFNLTCGVNF